jgi:serine/threonine protein phosphatase PrpC
MKRRGHRRCLGMAAGFLLLLLCHVAEAEHGAIAFSRLPGMGLVGGGGRIAAARRVLMLRGGEAGGGDGEHEGVGPVLDTGLPKSPGIKGTAGVGLGGEAVGRGRGVIGGGESEGEVARSKSPHEDELMGRKASTNVGGSPSARAGAPVVMQDGTACSEGDESSSSAREISEDIPPFRASPAQGGASIGKRKQAEVELEELETEAFGKPIKDSIADYMDSGDENDLDMQGGDMSPGDEWGPDDEELGDATRQTADGIEGPVDFSQLGQVEDEWEDGWGDDVGGGMMSQTGGELEAIGYNANVTDEDGCGSVFMMMGRREYMEDNYAMFLPYKETPGGSNGGVWGSQGEVPGLFGVFDGHGGANCSQYCRDHLLVRALEFNKGSGVEEEGGGAQGDDEANNSAVPGSARGGEDDEDDEIMAKMHKEAFHYTLKVDEAQAKAKARAKASMGSNDGKECAEGADGEAAGGGPGASGAGSLWSRELSSRWLKQAMQYAFTETDREWLQKYPVVEDGSTACVVAVTSRYIMCGNAGDSRAVLLDGDTVVPLSNDHKPSRRDELMRIEEAGGMVYHVGVPRVNGILAVSRAIGDAELKKFVISDPEIRTVLRSKSQRFILLATDGLWDVFSNHEAVQFIEDNWETPGHGCRALAREAYQRGSFDNVCCMVVDLIDGQGLAPLMSSDQDCSELSDQVMSGGSSTDLQDESQEDAMMRGYSSGPYGGY